MGHGYGFGKVILFGEHFVIYGTPGIVSAIDLTTEAEVRRGRDGALAIQDERRGTPGYIEAKRDQQQASIRLMLETLGLTGEGLRVRLWGSLPAYSGIGASAASCVAIARALSDEYALQLSHEAVNAAAYDGEKAYHGPSHAGLDNAAATFGGMLWFFKGPPPRYERLRVEQPFEIVIGNTGLVANTQEVIGGVAQRKAADPERYADLIRQADAVATDARAALAMGDLQALGLLMNLNHNLLQAIEVTCPELDRLVHVARQQGAVGAKSTGAGCGGCMMALTPGTVLQERVARGIEQEGFEALRTTVGSVAATP